MRWRINWTIGIKLTRISGLGDSSPVFMKQVPWRMTVRVNPGSSEQSQELFVRRTRNDRSQTGTRHVTHLILVSLLLVLVTHGRPHRGTFCLLSFKDRVIPFEASELSPQEVHFACGSFSQFRRVRTLLGGSLPPAQLQSEGTGTVKRRVSSV